MAEITLEKGDAAVVLREGGVGELHYFSEGAESTEKAALLVICCKTPWIMKLAQEILDGNI